MILNMIQYVRAAVGMDKVRPNLSNSDRHLRNVIRLYGNIKRVIDDPSRNEENMERIDAIIDDLDHLIVELHDKYAELALDCGKRLPKASGED